MRGTTFGVAVAVLLLAVGLAGTGRDAPKISLQAHCLELKEIPVLSLTVSNESEEDIDVSRFELFGLSRSTRVATPSGFEPLIKWSPTNWDPGPRNVDLVRVKSHSAISIFAGTGDPMSEAAAKVVTPGSAPVLKLSGTMMYEVAAKERKVEVSWEGRVFVAPKADSNDADHK